MRFPLFALLLLTIGCSTAYEPAYGVTLDGKNIAYDPSDIDWVKGEACLTGEQFVLGNGWEYFSRAAKGNVGEDGVVRWPQPKGGVKLNLRIFKCVGEGEQPWSVPIQLVLPVD